MTGASPDVLGRRIAAALIDILLLALVLGAVASVTGEPPEDGERTISASETIVFAILTLVYFGLSEAISGQTLGKRAMGIKVELVDGKKPGARAILVRTLLRIVDQAPAFYLVGLIAVLATGKRRQRLGDLAAGTRVVSARRR